MKKLFHQLVMIVMIVTTLFLTSNCKKDEDKTNQPPSAPTNLSPADKADSVSQSSALSWSVCIDPENDSVKYDIYLGTSTPPALVKSNWTSTIFFPNNLLPLTKYYWQIVAKDSKNNSTVSPIWSFSTLVHGDIDVLVCDATQTNYFGGVEVFMYLRDIERNNDPQRVNYYRKALTDNIDPVNNGARFYSTPNQKYYFFARREISIGSGNFLTGVGECYAQDGKKTKLIVAIQ